MSTIRKNLKFDDEDDRAKLVLKFLSYIPRRQADFITDLIFCHLEKCGVADPAKINKRVVESITRNVYRDAAEYGSKQQSELVALIDLMSKMMNQGQIVRGSNQSESTTDMYQDGLGILSAEKVFPESDFKTGITRPATKKFQNEEKDTVREIDTPKANAKDSKYDKSSEQNDISDEGLDDDQDEVPNDLNEYFDWQ